MFALSEIKASHSHTRPQWAKALGEWDARDLWAGPRTSGMNAYFAPPLCGRSTNTP